MTPLRSRFSISLPGFARVLAWLLPAVAVALIYLQVEDHMFIEFDDMYYTFENPMVVRGLSWEGVRWAFSDSHVANYHPLTWLSHMLDYTLFGNNSGAFALENSLLHALNAFLVARLIARLFDSPLIGIVAGIVFGVHPVLVEGVAWISQRKTVLSTFFALSAILLYLRSRFGVRAGLARAPYIASLFCYMLSLLAKGMYVTLPAALLLVEMIAASRLVEKSEAIGIQSLWKRVRSSARYIAPFAVLAVVVSIVTFWAQAGDNAVQSLDELSLANRLATVIHGYTTYLAQFIHPHRLSVYYPTNPDWGIGVLVGGGGILVALTAGLYLLRRYDSGRALCGWLLFVITLLPVIGLIQVGSQAHADRYMYGPVLGLLIAGASVTELARRTVQRREVRGALGLGFCVWLLLAGLACHRQVGRWHNSYSLAQSSLDAVGPEPQLLSMKAVILLRAKQYAAALTTCEEALALAPDCFPALQNKAICQESLGDVDGAISTTLRFVDLRPEDPAGWANLGYFLSKSGRTQEARAALAHARILPGITPSTHRLLEAVDATLAGSDSPGPPAP